MQQPLDPHGSGSPEHSEQRGGFNPKTAMLAFAFCTFVLGGFSFGWLFFTNWRLLGQFQAARMPIIDVPPIAVGPTVPGPRPVIRRRTT